MSLPHPYASRAYADAFDGNYTPVYLPESQIYVLKRAIPGTDYVDAMGCYPLTPLSENADLEKDFAVLRKANIVSLVLVTDPFFHPPVEQLQKYFDVAAPFKEHYLHRFDGARDYTDHHSYRVRLAMKKSEFRQIALSDYLEQWFALYQGLIKKRAITGIQAFPKSYFAALAELSPPMFGAFSEGELIAAYICVEHEGYAYSHLGAASEKAYRNKAAYGLHDTMIRHFSEKGAKAFDIGGGAGVSGASEGLAYFKQGFSNASALCYLCGKILDTDIYKKLSAGKATGFFPAYRG